VEARFFIGVGAHGQNQKINPKAGWFGSKTFFRKFVAFVLNSKSPY
jgi:hypothetical protein